MKYRVRLKNQLDVEADAAQVIMEPIGVWVNKTFYPWTSVHHIRQLEPEDTCHLESADIEHHDAQEWQREEALNGRR